MAMAANIFERLTKGRPPPIEKGQEISAPQLLLNFLQRWPEDMICLRDIQRSGPRAVRATQRNMLASIEVLVRHGWLGPGKSHRRDRRVWQINRRPTVHPIV
jgi:hypothetical protein